MIDHVVVKSTPALFDATVKFYEVAFEPLGYKKLRDIPNRAAGFGDAKPDFWVFGNGKDGETAHIALRAPDRESIRKFHDAGLKTGGKDNGAPGIREYIHPDCYAAFVHDPAGNNIEAVCHDPEI